MTSGKRLTPAGTESRIHVIGLLLCLDVLLLTFGALERRRSETVHVTSTRFTTFDIVDMSTMGRQYTEIPES